MARRRTFGHTWWGRAWIDALERRASLDPNRLPRARTYAWRGHVYDLEIEPGAIRSSVAGSRRTPYRVTVRFRVLSDAEWERVEEVIVAKAARAAALLDGELDPGLVADASAVGVELLPHAGELQPRCSCPDWADPCKHAAATCYLIADTLDTYPFALLLLRGRSRDQILASVRRRRSGGRDVGDANAAATIEPSVDAGVLARDVWKRAPAALPEVPVLRPAPSRLAVWPLDPPAAAAFTSSGLTALVVDAAARAWSGLADRTSLGLDLTEDQDLARRAARMLRADAPAPDELVTLARGAKMTPRALARRAIAWRVAGARGLAALDESPWRPDTRTMALARDDLVAAGVPDRRLKVDRNRITMGAVQLRLGLDANWYRFVKRGAAWELAAGPAEAADDLLDEDP